jgi:hypothetical protein
VTEDSTDNETVPGAISDLYREFATERPPESLDQSVLAEARRAVRKQNAPTLAWYRPVVFIGLFGLSLALLIEFSLLSPVEPDTGPESQDAVDPGAETVLTSKLECTAEEREEPATWWACIQELEAAGNTSAAEEELQSLLSAYPGFRSSAPANPRAQD